MIKLLDADAGCCLKMLDGVSRCYMLVQTACMLDVVC